MRLKTVDLVLPNGHEIRMSGLRKFAAAAVLSALPITAVFLLAQRWFYLLLSLTFPRLSF
ncbi:hypothetical protein [Moritella yayanosii]|uniref:hypothetical protein n=1 Tax=Moritella yayanosii TaxID=69539 RepID=UPI0013A699A9|nr:hypothetical protein [Moritella yayanosii]